MPQLHAMQDEPARTPKRGGGWVYLNNSQMETTTIIKRASRKTFVYRGDPNAGIG